MEKNTDRDNSNVLETRLKKKGYYELSCKIFHEIRILGLDESELPDLTEKERIGVVNGLSTG
jgi:hypothetical protein